MYHITQLSLSRNVRNSHVTDKYEAITMRLIVFFLRDKQIIIPIYIWYWLLTDIGLASCSVNKRQVCTSQHQKLIIFCRGCMFQLAVSNFFDKKRKLILRSYVRESSFFSYLYARISVRLNINFVIDNQNKRLTIVL